MLAIAVIAIIGMLLAEATLRLFSPQIFPHEPIYVPDPDLGHGLRPGYEGWLRRSEYRVRVAINEQGLRGPALAPAAENTVRILCLGDSQTFGNGVEYERAYPALTEVILREHHPRRDVQVVNAGIPQYGTIDERNFLAKRGEEIGPGVVVVQFYAGDDFEQNRLPSGERNVFQGTEMVNSARFSAARDPLWLRLLNSTKHHSHLVHWISERAGRLLMRMNVLGDMEHASSSHFSEEDARRAHQLLAEIQALSARLGARMMVVFVPERMQVVARPAGPLPAAEVVREAAGETGAAFLDLTPALVSSADVEHLYRFEVGMWTEAGHRLVAEVLAREIDALGWIDEAR